MDFWIHEKYEINTELPWTWQAQRYRSFTCCRQPRGTVLGTLSVSLSLASFTLWQGHHPSVPLASLPLWQALQSVPCHLPASVLPSEQLHWTWIIPCQHLLSKYQNTVSLEILVDTPLLALFMRKGWCSPWKQSMGPSSLTQPTGWERGREISWRKAKVTVIRRHQSRCLPCQAGCFAILGFAINSRVSAENFFGEWLCRSVWHWKY